jgi:hypothetical protein
MLPHLGWWNIGISSYGSLGHARRFIEANRGFIHAFPFFHMHPKCTTNSYC